MKLGRQLRFLLAALLAGQVLTALAGIGLLERMSPAIGHILEDNVASAQAVETMLRVLAEPAVTDTDRERFLDALGTAEGNVTEPEERPLLDTIRRRASAALAGDARARHDVATALEALGEINREAMVRADREARRLGSAGRWALAFLALGGLLLIAIAARRTQRRLLAPLAELEAVVGAHRAGDGHRRCRPHGGSELGDILDGVNRLLDRDARAHAGGAGRRAAIREALVLMLDERPAPALVLDRAGEVIAASQDALDLMASRGEEILDAARSDEPAPAGIESARTTDSGLKLVHLTTGTEPG